MRATLSAVIMLTRWLDSIVTPEMWGVKITLTVAMVRLNDHPPISVRQPMPQLRTSAKVSSTVGFANRGSLFVLGAAFISPTVGDSLCRNGLA